MADAPFPVDPELTAVAVRYRNPRFIADLVAPRLRVGRQTFKYWLHTMAEDFTIPDTRVGRRSAPAEIEFSATEATGATVDYGLDDPIPQADIDNAPPGHDPLMRATEGLTDLIALDREKRVAGLVFAAASYASGNKTTLSGTSQWSDTANSKPIKAIGDALDTPIIRPNVGVIGRAAFTGLRSHPDIVKAVQGNAGDAGRATAQQIAELFELDALYVGEGWVNSAKRGQTASLARVWGKHLALIYLDRNADAAGNRASFCWTAEWGSRIAGAMPDTKIGLRGGQRVRVGESVAEVISANDLGYFMQNVVA
jgi:hypothetical protein